MASGGPPRYQGPPRFQQDRPNPNIMRTPRGPGGPGPHMNFAPRNYQYQPPRQPQFFPHIPHPHGHPPQPHMQIQRSPGPRPPYGPYAGGGGGSGSGPAPIPPTMGDGGQGEKTPLDPSYLEGCASLLDQIDSK
jgi:hypothetical protein